MIFLNYSYIKGQKGVHNIKSFNLCNFLYLIIGYERIFIIFYPGQFQDYPQFQYGKELIIVLNVQT